MHTTQFSPTGFVTGDSTLQIDYPSSSHPGVVVTCTAPGDQKWVYLGLQLDARVYVKEVTVSYQVTSTKSCIRQVRLVSMDTPDQATVVHDDGTTLQSTAPTEYTSDVAKLVTSQGCTLMLMLRLSFEQTTDRILLGAVRVRFNLPVDRWQLDVRAYGAIGDGSSHPLSEFYASLGQAQADFPHALSLSDEVDWAGIQKAIEACKALGKATVYLPPGRYRLRRAVRPEVDDITLLGSPGSTLIMDPASPADTPEAVLVNKSEFGVPAPAEVRRVTVENITIEITNGPGANQASVGAVQINNCQDCVVRNVHVLYTGAARKPHNLDGIATSQGTSGLIQGCVIDGIPKVGIYIAQGSHDVLVDACEARNIDGPLGHVGMSVSGADRVTIQNCYCHHNAAAGLLIAVNGPIDQSPPTPATNVRVVGGRYHDNALYGIQIGSQYAMVGPSNIELVDVAALNNGFRGIEIEAGQDVLIAGVTVGGSGNAGIWVENRTGERSAGGIFDPAQPRTTRVQIVNPNVFDNGRTAGVDVPGIGLMAVDQVNIIGGRIYKTPAMSTRRQNYGIGLHKNENGHVCRYIRIMDVDAAGGHKQGVAPLDASTMVEDLNAVAQIGYYRLQAAGSPEGVLCAPPGSEYVDIASGAVFRKAVGPGPTGWKQIS